MIPLPTPKGVPKRSRAAPRAAPESAKEALPMTRADLNDPLFPLEVLARRSPDPLSRSTMALILAGGEAAWPN